MLLLTDSLDALSVSYARSFMHANCPVSCKICRDINCSDKADECAQWMANGECETSSKLMLVACPVSCGICSPPCKDLNGGIKIGPNSGITDSPCEMWAKQGQCETNADYMLKQCPVACGACRAKRKDKDKLCNEWAHNGECQENSGFMFKNCPIACGIGGDDPCVDSNATACVEWFTRGECEANPRCAGSSHTEPHSLLAMWRDA